MEFKNYRFTVRELRAILEYFDDKDTIGITTDLKSTGTVTGYVSVAKDSATSGHIVLIADMNHEPNFS